jgi:hypothetical protein
MPKYNLSELSFLTSCKSDTLKVTPLPAVREIPFFDIVPVEAAIPFVASLDM